MKLPLLPFDILRLDTVELVPFRAGIRAGARAVMSAHLALPRIDSSRRPATLSAPILTGVLREHLSFDGIVMTDGMQMQGVTDQFSTGEAAVLALEAGADVVLAPPDIDDAFKGVLAAVRSGRLRADRVNSSARRILAAKSWVGLPKNRLVSLEAISSIVGAPSFQSTAEEISDASITLLRNKRNLLPLRPSTRLHIVAVTEEPSTQVGIDLLQGVDSILAGATVTRVSNGTGRERFAELRDHIKDADAVCVGIYLSVVAWGGKERFARPLEEFLASLGDCPKPVILVAFGDPYVLGKLPETDVVMTPYNGALVGERSVARALTGRTVIRGRLPVTIPGRYKRGDGLTLNAAAERLR